MSTDTQPAPEIVVTADEWIMTAGPTWDQQDRFNAWLDEQTGIDGIAGQIDAFAIDGDRLWGRTLNLHGPSTAWRSWPVVSPLPAEVAVLALLGRWRRDR